MRTLRGQLFLLVLLATAVMAISLLWVLQRSSHRMVTQQMLDGLNWRPFLQARQVRQHDLGRIAQLMAGDALLVAEWRGRKRAIAAYLKLAERGADQEQLRLARAGYLGGLWDISQRLFLESEPEPPASGNIAWVPACADLLLMLDGSGRVLLECRTDQSGRVAVHFPLDPNQSPLPEQPSIGPPADLHEGDYFAYGRELYQGIARRNPAGGWVVLGDRLDDHMAAQATHMVGGGHCRLFDQAGRQLGGPPGPVLPGDLSRTYTLTDHHQKRLGTIVFSRSGQDLLGLLRQQNSHALALVLASVLLAVALSAPLTNSLARPLVALSAAMEKVGQGDLEAGAVEDGPLEVQRAARAFNQMVGGLRQKETLEKALARLEELRKSADVTDPLVRDQTQFGEWVIWKRLGSGGMAAVYAALPKDTLNEDERVAIKVINRTLADDPEYQARFRHEFTIMRQLEHPGLVRVLETGHLNGLLYIAMEFVDGVTLRERIDRQGPFTVEEFLPLARDLTEALWAAHQRGVLHRDLKPENIMLTARGVKVMDFGLAVSDQITRVTMSGTSVGTPAYMAPEHIQNRGAGPSADQYSLGILFYEMLSGHLPFQADTPMGLLVQHLTEMPSPLEGVGPLGAIVMRMLAKEPAERYADLGALRVDL
jgi:hypothetical protein